MGYDTDNSSYPIGSSPRVVFGLSGGTVDGGLEWALG
jgi:hypothetical protein